MLWPSLYTTKKRRECPLSSRSRRPCSAAIPPCPVPTQYSYIVRTKVCKGNLGVSLFTRLANYRGSIMAFSLSAFGNQVMNNGGPDAKLILSGAIISPMAATVVQDSSDTTPSPRPVTVTRRPSSCAVFPPLHPTSSCCYRSIHAPSLFIPLKCPGTVAHAPKRPKP